MAPVNGTSFSGLSKLVSDEWTAAWTAREMPLSDVRLIAPVSFGYLAAVALLWMFMRRKERQATKGIRYFSAAHNALLCLASLYIFVGISRESWALYQASGSIRPLFCGLAGASEFANSRIYYWGYLYHLTKFYEFIDTGIIVVRKAPLTFLHVFHHGVVPLMSWAWLETQLMHALVFGIWFNTLVHVIMYYYFSRTSLGHRIWWRSYITLLQIVQFVSSFALSLVYIGYLYSGYSCTGMPSFCFSVVLNSIFLCLFVRLYQAGRRRPPAEPRAAGKKVE